MRLIINTTTLSGTGVTQVACSFINECKDFPDINYYVFLSKTVAGQIDVSFFPSNFQFFYFEDHPLYGTKGFKVRKELRRLEREIKPDVVFTVFGPACWTPQVPHISGFANSYYVFPNSPFFDVISKKDWFRIYLLKIAHRFFLKRNGRFFICETEAMRIGLADYLKIPLSRIFTVSNTYSKIYDNEEYLKRTPLLTPAEVDEFRFLILASYDIHKNLTILNNVIPLLQDLSHDVKIKFVLTISDKALEENFREEVKKTIINLGRVDVNDCPGLYEQCDAVFLPTLIESFSANYPEAMKMRKPIMTSDLPFARSICEDAAYYFDPLDPNDIVTKIVQLVNNPTLRNNLIEKGSKRLSYFGDSKQRTSNYLKIINSII